MTSTQNENDYDAQYSAWMQQPPKQAMQSVTNDIREYTRLVNRIAEVIRLSDDIAKIPLDTDLTIADLMMTLVRRGEKLSQKADMLHDYASRLETD